MSGLTRLFPLKILPSNPTRKKPSFITLFPSFCIYLLCSSSVSISKNCISELHQLKSPPFTIQNIKNSLQFPPSLPKSIIFYNFVQKYHLVSKIEAYLSTQITKKKSILFYSFPKMYTPTNNSSTFIHSRSKNSWRGREKAKKIARILPVPGRNPLSNHERRRDKLISIQSVVSTDVEPIPEMGPKSNLVKIISR